MAVMALASSSSPLNSVLGEDTVRLVGVTLASLSSRHTKSVCSTMGLFNGSVTSSPMSQSTVSLDPPPDPSST